MPFLLLMPSYNHARYIAEAITSVLAQDDPEWELWIVDNSTDETPEVMKFFDDPRIHYHHIPKRMDPGSCLNWMLERAKGNTFSYVHTDNRLRPGYISSLRRALEGRPLGLAYCDMYEIDSDGALLRHYRRGAFDFARLHSLSPLGVPFAATTALAKAVGGFRPNDLADDVRFSMAAYGIADYVYIPLPLIDYRTHGLSRTSSSGWPRIRQALLDLALEMRLRQLARGGPDPLDALAQSVNTSFVALEQYIEDLWQRRMSRVLAPWWNEGQVIDHLFHAGFIRVKGFSGTEPKPPLKPFIRREGRIRAWPWSVYIAAVIRSRYRDEIWDLADQFHGSLPAWAYLAKGSHVESFRVNDTTFRSLFAARALEMELGWKPFLSADARRPEWLAWPTALGLEPVLRLGAIPQLKRSI